MEHTRPTQRATLAERLDQQTVALVNVIDQDSGVTLSSEELGGPAAEAVQVRCAGVWVSNVVFVTAFHCVADLGAPTGYLLEALVQHIEPWDPAGQWTHYSMHDDTGTTLTGKRIRYDRPAQVLVTDRRHDLALVRASRPGTHPVASVARAYPRDGDGVHVVGHTQGY